jgi:2-C-methyl-D-erythritol 4-phosphate cytidylyltransferase
MSVTLSAVLPAAGSSQRLGFNKLLTPVNGVTFLQYTLQRVLKSTNVTEVIVVIAAGTEDNVRPIIEKLRDPRPIKLVPGGAQRQDSVMAGLRATSPASEYVMIHDAARPFITPQLIDLVAEGAVQTGAAVCGHPSTDTLKTADGNGAIVETLDREKIWAVQTPQIFRRQLIIDAYQQSIAADRVVTDDTAVVTELGIPVKLVRHDGINLKITLPGDWSIASQMLLSVEEDLKATADIRKLIHDISNQMTSIMGFSFLLDMDVPEDSPLKDHVKALNESSQKCHAIVEAMQNVARDMHARKNATLQQLEGNK